VFDRILNLGVLLPQYFYRVDLLNADEFFTMGTPLPVS